MAGEAASSVLGAILEQASKNILEKLQKGKKLTLEDLVFLWLDLVYNRVDKLDEKIEEVRRESGENYRRLKEKIEALRREIMGMLNNIYQLLLEIVKEHRS